MSDIVDSASVPVFALDRAIFVSRAALIEIVRFHLNDGAIVQVEDRKRPRGDRFRYEIRSVGGAMQVVYAAGRQMGVYADVEALVAYAEAVTGI